MRTKWWEKSTQSPLSHTDLHLVSVSGFRSHSWVLTYAVGLHVALVGHAVAPQTLMGVASRQAVLHPVVGRGGDDQQDVANNRAEEAPSHEAVHPELKQRSFCRAAVITANRQGYRAEKILLMCGARWSTVTWSDFFFIDFKWVIAKIERKNVFLMPPACSPKFIQQFIIQRVRRPDSEQ